MMKGAQPLFLCQRSMRPARSHASCLTLKQCPAPPDGDAHEPLGSVLLPGAGPRFAALETACAAGAVRPTIQRVLLDTEDTRTQKGPRSLPNLLHGMYRRIVHGGSPS